MSRGGRTVSTKKFSQKVSGALRGLWNTVAVLTGESTQKRGSRGRDGNRR
ncbi:MAG TPA: hypothetical protein VGH99_03845 [Pseudonocardia sp.]|jgi:hypothetical protein